MKYIVSQSLYIYKTPSSQSEKLGILYPGFIIDATEETEGELLHGEKIWLKDANGFFYWKGAVNFHGEQEHTPTIVNYNELLSDIPAHIRTNKGAGITIAILDTGCINHPDLEDRIDCFYDVEKNKEISVPSEYYDGSDHGTFVAGLMASSGRTSGIVGIAPQARLIIIKVSKRSNNGNEEGYHGYSVWKALEWLLSLSAKPNIINLSFNIDADTRYKDRIGNALSLLKESGCHIIAAAGNNKSIFGEKGILYPSGAPDVWAAGAIYETFETTELLNSQIKFAVPYGQNYRSLGREHSPSQKQGSSFASAIVSAAMALIESYNKTQGTPGLHELSDYVTQYDGRLYNEQLKIHKNEETTA